LYAWIYYAWVSATPVSPEILPSVKLYATIWFSGFILDLVAFVAVSARLAYLYARRKKSMKIVSNSD